VEQRESGHAGISYYASNQWRVAGHPSAAPRRRSFPWEGQNDRYRDSGYHGGILVPVPGALGQAPGGEHPVRAAAKRAKKNPNTVNPVAGPVTLSDEELARNRVDAFEELKKHPLFDDWHRSRTADLSLVRTPLLTCANWGGQGIHPRGNFNGYTETPADTPKWLEAHGDSHWSLFSSDYGLDLQKRFFDHFLKGEKNGWDKQPKVQLNIRHPGERFVRRHENEWPLARTQWTKFYLDPAGKALSAQPLAQAGKTEYEASGSGVTFSTPPLERETEITGPMMARLHLSSSTKDTDLFLIVRVFDPAGKELTFMGSTDPNTPIANGWLRASHRRLDPQRSKPWRPYHPHDRAEPLTPGEIYECDVEIVTSCIVVPAGWRVALTVRGKDYEYEGELTEFGKKFHYGTRGTGGMTHNDPDSRPADVFGGKVTLHSGGGRESYLLLPIIPPK
jgi:predicted acyl esterase